MQDSTFNGRFLVNRVIGDSETERGNHVKANKYLNIYINYIDSLYTSERSVDVQQLIYDYNTQLKLKDEQANNERRQNRIIITSIIIVFLLTLVITYIHYKNKHILQKQKNELSQLEIELSNKKQIIADNLNDLKLLKQSETEKVSQIKTLKEKSSDLASDIKVLNSIIRKKELAVLEAQKQALTLSNNYFRKTKIYSDIVARNKKVKNKNILQVLTHKEQEQLQEEVFEIYSAYVNQLKESYPLLKDEDLLLFCLDAAKVDNQVIALCLGSIDLHIVYNRRARARDRMKPKTTD